MGVILKYCLAVLLGFLLLLLGSCRVEKFAEEGYFSGDVDKYFNEKEKVNIWVYRAFQPRDTGNTGLRIDKFYPLDERMLKSAGLNKNGDKILFSVVPDSKPYYNLIVLKHKKRRFAIDDFEQKIYEKAPYYIRDLSTAGMISKHVYIPYGKKESISLLFYALEAEGKSWDKPLARFEYLAKINALEAKEEMQYKSDWQIFDCDGPEKEEWTIVPNANLLKGRNTVYLKLYDIYGANKTISYFKLIKKYDLAPIQLKLCPNAYVLEYVDEEGKILETSEFRIGTENKTTGN